MKKALVSFEDFSFRYKSQQKPTLKNINLQIYEGEKILILGASGSGKSTLGYCINGLIPNRFSGEINGSCTVVGRDISAASVFTLSQHIGSVLQDSDAQFVGLSVGEDIAFSLENQNIPRKQMLEKVRASAKTVGIEDQLDLLPYSLSGGQKQRASIAGILHEDIDLILFDEPLAALDPHMGKVTVELIEKLNQQHKKTIVIIEHRLEDVLHRGVDRIVLMDKGEIVVAGTVDELLRSNYLREFGIREPLYISALKNMYGGLKQQTNLGHLDTIDLKLYNDKTVESVHVKDTKEPSNEEILAFNQIDFGYEEDSLIHIEHLSIKKGERISLIGENGAGKSTLAKLSTGVLRPKNGEIYVNGKNYEMLTIQEIAKEVGYVMQNPNQMLVKDTVYEEVAYALQLREYDNEEINVRTERILKLTDLFKMRNWPISALSYGQKKRLSVAVVLVLEPKCLILDEPTAGQDYANYREIMEFVDRLNREQQTAILFITHDMHLALEYTDRAIVLSEGKVLSDTNVFDTLNDSSIISKAGLKRTSIFDFAEQLNIDGKEFLKQFIFSERSIYKNGKQ